MVITLLFYIFVAFTAIQITYHIIFTRFISTPTKTEQQSTQVPVSVLICAKNEAANLKKNLKAVCQQIYPEFEIILIDDASTDETLAIMNDVASNQAHVKVISVEANERFWGNKKYALTLGIKAATHEHLLFTDADCEVLSAYWIQEMSAQFSTEKSIVLGYGKYRSETTNLLSFLVKYETLLTAVQYFSYAKLGSPYMGVGRNLAYKKSVFFKVNGFIKHIQERSGDDDLFVQQAANKTNTAICVSPNSFTVSDAPKSFKAWYRQKRRHISTAKFYQPKHKFLLSFFYFTKLCLFILALLLVFLFDWKIILPILAAYYSVLLVTMHLSAKKLAEEIPIWKFPFLEISLLCFQLVIFIANTISKSKHWK